MATTAVTSFVHRWFFQSAISVQTSFSLISLENKLFSLLDNYDFKGEAEKEKKIAGSSFAPFLRGR